MEAMEDLVDWLLEQRDNASDMQLHMTERHPRAYWEGKTEAYKDVLWEIYKRAQLAGVKP